MQEVSESKDFLGPLAVGSVYSLLAALVVIPLWWMWVYFLVVDRLYHRYGVSKGGEGSTRKLPRYINEAVR